VFVWPAGDRPAVPGRARSGFQAEPVRSSCLKSGSPSSSRRAQRGATNTRRKAAC